MTGIKLNVDANVNTADLNAQISKIASDFNAIGAAISKANSAKFSPVTDATLSDVKKLNDNYKEMLKLQSSFRDRLKATGQSGLPFESLDFNRLYTDPAQAHRSKTNAFNHITQGTAFGSRFSPLIVDSPKKPQGPTELAPIAPPRQPQPERWSGTVPGRVFNSGLRAAGPIGGVAANSLDSGMNAGIGAGVGGLMGGLLALGVGKAVSAVSSKVGDAGQEAIGTDTLKRSLGDISTDFVTLREKVRSVADSMGLTFTETHKVAAEFSKMTGSVKPSELVSAIGFGRGFGIGPSESSQFFGSMRQSGATSNDTDGKRLALNIAESIGRAGIFTKTDEVLHAVANFADQTASQSMTRANSDGYIGALTGLSGSKLPGMTPGAASSILSHMNSSIQNGGSAGEAGQNFMYRAINGDRKLSPFEAKLMQEGGMFATRSSVLGKGSLYSQSMGQSFEGGDSVFDSIRSQLGANYKDKRLRVMALSSLTGINNSQAMAMDQFAGQHGEGKVGAMADFLKSKGIDISKVNAGGMGALASLQSGGMGVLRDQARSLLGRSGSDALSDTQASALNGALSKGDAGKEDLRKMLIELTATRDQEKTEGGETRKSIADASNLAQRAATSLLGPINTMRDAMVLMAGGGKLGASGIAEAVRKIERAEIERKSDAEYSSTSSSFDKKIAALKMTRKMSPHERNNFVAMNRGMDPKELKAILDEDSNKPENTNNAAIDNNVKDLENLKIKTLKGLTEKKNSVLGTFDNSSVDSTGKSNSDLFSGISPERSSIIKRIAGEHGVDQNAMAAVLRLERSASDDVVNPTSKAAGAWQIMPANSKAYGGDPKNFSDGAGMAAKVLKDAAKRYPGDIRAQIAYYNGGKSAGDAVSAGNAAPTAEGRDYVSRFDAMRSGSNMPDGASPGPSATEQQSVRHHITVDPLDVKVNGAPAGKVALNVHTGKAQAAGSRQ